MREVGLPQGHEARVEVSPDEEQQKRHSGIIFVEDGVEHGEKEVDAEKDFGIRHPTGFVLVFFCDERISLAFDLVFGCARELGFLADNGFDDSLRVANGNSDTGGHYKRHVQKSAPPILGTQFLLRYKVSCSAPHLVRSHFVVRLELDLL